MNKSEQDILEVVVNGKLSLRKEAINSKSIDRLFTHTLGVPRSVTAAGLTGGIRKLESDGVYSFHMTHGVPDRYDDKCLYFLADIQLGDSSGQNLAESIPAETDSPALGEYGTFLFKNGNPTGYTEERKGVFTHRLLGRITDLADGRPGLCMSTGSVFFKNGLVHKEDGPAVVPNKGAEIYSNTMCVSFSKPAFFQNNVPHRLDGPAITIHNKRYYCVQGYFHRLDGPAVVSKDVREWYKYGRLHRENGPARVSDRFTEHYLCGLKHNLMGPAIVGESVFYYILGKLVTKQEWSRLRKRDDVLAVVRNTIEANDRLYSDMFSQKIVQPTLQPDSSRGIGLTSTKTSNRWFP